ncbi:MAG: TlpA disulfide reductase family protein, partial [Chloroflexota bacterium]|nr:TlpA disulfide reductase family protein [Chloroflexota bacterium]
MRLPDYLGVLGALVVGGVLTIVLLAGSLGTAPALPTRPPVSIPPLPTPTRNDSLPSPLPSGTPITGSLAIGQHAPELRVTLTDGSLMDTADFAGLPIWVNFTASWCPQCTIELPMMERFQRQLKDQMTVLVVDVGEDRSTVREFINGLNVDLTVGLDPDGTIAAQWGA